MTNHTNKIEELESLLMDWECDSLSPAGLERLREILKTDGEARSRFVRMQMLRVAMHLESDSGLALPLSQDATEPVRVSPPARRWSAVNALVAIAASLVIGVLGGRFLFSNGGSGREKQPVGLVRDDAKKRDASREATSEGVALVTRLVDVTWEDAGSAIEAGQALAPGRFAIRGGHAQIEFFSGATVVVEGPAELELDSPYVARVRHGRLRAHVPPAARGFSLEVEDMKVVDLGTEFGLSVTPQGAQVHVFEGEVELQRPASENRLVGAGQSIVRTIAGNFEELRVAPDRFMGIAELASRAETQRLARYERWKIHASKLRRDPRLIAYYAFDQTGDWQRRLACSTEPANSELDGAIVGARELDGRWTAKRALEFKQPADRVRVEIPGEFSSLTLACWTKIDSLDRWYNSLFLTDGYDKGEPHWQIMDTGELYFSVRPAAPGEAGPRDFKAMSPVFWNPTLNGKWIHLAVTCDVESRTIAHYLNGTELSRHEVPAEQMPLTTRIGTASIGNWALPTMPDARFAIRNLNGSIDEFAIFAAALSPDELKEMYVHGKP